MNKTKQVLLMVITLVLCVLLFLQPLTGEIWHAVFGILLLFLFCGHMYKHSKKLKYRSKRNQVVDWIMIAALAVVIISGILLHPLHGLLAVKIVHKLSALIFVLGILVHAVQNLRKKKSVS